MIPLAPWWANGAVTKAGQWVGIPDGSHFDGPVPIDEVRRCRTCGWCRPPTYAEYEDEDGER